MREKTKFLITKAYEVLQAHNPMTLRQVFYRLVAGHVLENTQSQYKSLGNHLVAARQQGMIPWHWMEDRLRRPRSVSMWDDLADFAETAARAYRRDVWVNQPEYCEVWLEKDALSGIFERVLHAYGVTLNVGRGYDSWSAIWQAAGRFTKKSVTILYFGDFDPSGEDMVRSLRERLDFFGCHPNVVKCALTLDDIARYDLPPDFTKASDTRAAAFVEKYGDMAVELDALPPDVLEEAVRNAVEEHMDLEAFEEVRERETIERQQLVELLGKA